MPSAKTDKVGEAGPPVPGARLSSKKYVDKDTSDLRAKVKPGTNVVPLELTGSAGEEPRAEPMVAPNVPGTNPSAENTGTDTSHGTNAASAENAAETKP